MRDLQKLQWPKVHSVIPPHGLCREFLDTRRAGPMILKEEEADAANTDLFCAGLSRIQLRVPASGPGS